MGRDWSPDDREPESRRAVAGGGSTPPRRAGRLARARRGGARAGGGERFLVVRVARGGSSPSRPPSRGRCGRSAPIAPSRHRTSRRIAMPAIAHGLTARCDDSCGMGGSAPRLRPAATVAAETPVLTLTRDGPRSPTARHARRAGDSLGTREAKGTAARRAIYRMAMAATERAQRSGHTVRRVVLDAELKGQLASARNRPGTDAPKPGPRMPPARCSCEWSTEHPDSRPPPGCTRPARARARMSTSNSPPNTTSRARSPPKRRRVSPRRVAVPDRPPLGGAPRTAASSWEILSL